MWEIQAAEEKKKILLQHLQVLEEQRDKQMKVYQVAHRDREMITDIFEQQSDAHKQEQTRTQQKTLDDIFIARRPRS
jgi:flagellar biosynthesis/type III secretory pathway chaperone